MSAIRCSPSRGSVLAQLTEALRAPVLLRVFIPTRDRDGRPLPSRALRRWAEDRLVLLAGGATSHAGVGAWRNDRGSVERERVAIVEAHLTETLGPEEKALLLDLVASLCIEADQQGVAVAVVSGSPIFIVRRDDLVGGSIDVVPARPLEATPIG